MREMLVSLKDSVVHKTRMVAPKLAVLTTGLNKRLSDYLYAKSVAWHNKMQAEKEVNIPIEERPYEENVKKGWSEGDLEEEQIVDVQRCEAKDTDA